METESKQILGNEQRTEKPLAEKEIKTFWNKRQEPRRGKVVVVVVVVVNTRSNERIEMTLRASHRLLLSYVL